MALSFQASCLALGGMPRPALPIGRGQRIFKSVSPALRCLQKGLSRSIRHAGVCVVSQLSFNISLHPHHA